ncbi:MAG: glycoside hydrolase family 2 protein [Thermoleophilaceae bacterium]
MFSRILTVIAVLTVGLCLPVTAGAARSASPPGPITMKTGWEVRDLFVPPAPPQPPPPDESEEGSETPQAMTPVPKRLPFNPNWRATTVPNIFDPDASPELYGGSAKQYRLRFRAPSTKQFTWAFHFEQARRRTTVLLNGRRLGVSVDPYTPFQFAAKGLKPGQMNELLVTVDSRKDPRLPEGWWNWGGITRPVTMVPQGRVTMENLAMLSDVTCTGPATGCKAGIKLDGILSKLPADKTRSQPKLTVKIKSPAGRVTRNTYYLAGYRSKRVRINELEEMPVPAPQLWSPDRPQLYEASATLTYDGKRQQIDRHKIGLKSVTVVDGLLRLNNRAINLRGASMHEDMPDHGAALTGYDMDTMVRELKELGANVTRAHYVLSEGLLDRLDKAGIMVWNEAPVWQRDHGANLLQYANERARALAQVKRTVMAARNHPSVITHSVANELTFTPDRKTGTRKFLIAASEAARDLDPTRPISLDIKGRPGYQEQFTYEHFDMLGINQYFGWYPWVEDFNTLEPYLRQMHDLYPGKALVNTEFGAEGRGQMANYPAETKGSYAFQANHVARTLGLIDRLPFMSGAIHWTNREFEIYPGWYGGVTTYFPGRNTRHYKGLLTYNGQKKPAWQVVHDDFARTPLYR